MSKISKNQDFAKFLKRGFPKGDFFRKWTSLYVCMNRSKICYHVYLYVIWHFVINFLGFLENDDFWKLSWFSEKVTWGHEFLENWGLKLRKSGKKGCSRKKLSILSHSSSLFIISRFTPGVDQNFVFSENVTNCQKS